MPTLHFSLRSVRILLLATFGALLVALAVAQQVSQTPVVLVAAAAATPTPTPGLPSKITFDPGRPSVTPGNRVVVTATVRDANNVAIPGAKVKWKLADEDLKDFVVLSPDENTESENLTAVGLFGNQKSSDPPKTMPGMVPVIVTHSGITRVLNLRLTDTGKPPGPIPPGLEPQVDVMWSVLSQDVIHDNFGSKIKKQYYGIQVVIGNNSGYDLQIASIGFTLHTRYRPHSPSGAKRMIPSTSYQIARGSLVRAQEFGVRAKVMNSINALGPVLTGFVPFFKVTNRRSNFSQLINIFSNPFEEGAKLIFPDTTIGQLNRLEQNTYRNDQNARTIIPNNTQLATVAFFPKDFFKLRGGGRSDDPLRKGRDDPLTVMEALGDLVLIGEQVQYLNRVRLVGLPGDNLAYSISGRVTDECGNGIPDVSVTITGGVFFKETTVKTNAEGVYLFEKIPAGGNYKVSAAKNGVTIRGEGDDAFLLKDDRENVNFVGKQATYTISGKALGPTGQGIKGITVKLTGVETMTTTTGDDGSFKFENLTPGLRYVVGPEDGGGFKFDKATNTQTFGLLNCNQPNADFRGTGAAATPAPTP